MTTLHVNSAAERFVGEAGRIVDRDIAVYGLPPASYESLLKYLVDPNMHDFRLNEIREFAPKERSRLLDLGCGPGTLVLKASRLGLDTTGIDLSEDKVQLGHLWAEAMGVPEFAPRLQVANAANMPFDDNEFDVVSSYHVLEHVSDLRSVLYEAVRVTKRGGWLHLCAPDYRMSYDTHYCMPWPRFMPPEQSRRWARAMGRADTGVGSFFYITAPEVNALLQALGCRVHSLVMRTHYQSRVAQWDGNLTVDPIVFRSDAEVDAFAGELNRLKAAGSLPAMYETCLEFTIVAQRL